MLNEQFFAAIRSSLYRGTISQPAVDGINAIVAAFDGFSGAAKCKDDLAAILATCYLETGMNMDLSVREYGLGKGKVYGVPDGDYKQVYYGRGPCQITWLENYTIAEKRTGVHFVQFPDLMCDPKYGVAYMIDAMYAGLFTKKGLRNYITPGIPTTKASFASSRAIINGTDKASIYAGYCLAFQAALAVGYTITQPTAPKVPASTPVAVTKPKGLLAGLLAWFHSKNG